MKKKPRFQTESRLKGETQYLEVKSHIHRRLDHGSLEIDVGECSLDGRGACD